MILPFAADLFGLRRNHTGDPRVADVMQLYLTADQLFANPASRSHMLAGRQNKW